MSSQFKFRSHYSPRESYEAVTFEPVSDLPSKTVPGQDMSVRELLQRYVRGEVLSGPEPAFDEEFDSSLSRMDAQDKIMLARQVRQGIRQFQETGAPKPQTVEAETVEVEPTSE